MYFYLSGFKHAVQKPILNKRNAITNARHMFFYSIYAPDYQPLFVADIVSTNKVPYIFGLAP